MLLLFGNSGPMSTTLPRYLSSALTRRLRQFGVEVEERAMTWYVAMDRPMPTSPPPSSGDTRDIDDAMKSDDDRRSPPRLELYTVKSYNNLDSKRILTDLAGRCICTR